MNFDEPIDRRGTDCNKWDDMERVYGISPDDGIAMWVADSDFRPPACVQRAVQKIADHGVYGYGGDQDAYREAVCWWMDTRHGWRPDPSAIFATYGLVNAVGLCLHTWSDPSDAVVVMAPVYHAFGRVIRAAKREMVELPLRMGDHAELDIEAWDAMMTGREKILILCSPHNPAGRVWTRAELEAIAAFCRRHDVLLISDEVHADMIFPGYAHTAMPLVEGVEDRLVILQAASKAFNLAGAYLGQAIIPDPKLQKDFVQTIRAFSISTNLFAVPMTTAAFSPEGAAWIDAQMDYLDKNRAEWEAGINALPGVRAVPLQATYLSWVDFRGTGMSQDEVNARVHKTARLAVHPGTDFGLGGEGFMRFNIGTQRANITEALSRLHDAFGDLQ